MRFNKTARKLTHWTLRRVTPHRWRIRWGKGLLHLGICLNHWISRFSPFMQVAGDECVARELGEALARHCPQIGSWQLYDAKEAFRIKADVVIVLWPDYPPIKQGSVGKTLMWLQNGGWAARIPRLQEQFDIVCCASTLLCERFPGLIYLPVALNHLTLWRPLPPDPRFQTDVCFLGNYYRKGRSGEHATRYMLPATEFRFAIWGSGWEEADPPILRQFTRGRLPIRLGPIVLNSCQVLLPYHSQFHREDDMPSGRVFDALACEVFTISDHMPSLDIFSPYVVFTTGGEDLREKLRYYLAHPEERSAKVKSARAFILREHTNFHRARELAKLLGLSWVDDVESGCAQLLEQDAGEHSKPASH